MSILRVISEARLAFREKHGNFPTQLVACPATANQIKSSLYENLGINPAEIPLSRYDGMEVVVSDDGEGWRLEG